MTLLTCGTVIHAEPSAGKEVDVLVGAKNLNDLVQVLEEAVGGGKDDQRSRYCRALTDHIKGEALPNTFRAELLTLVVRFGGSESVEFLSSLLNHEDPVLHTRAVLGLQQNLSESAGVALRKALAEASNPETQAVFIHALIERGDAAGLPQFIQLAESKDAPVRNLALHGVSLMSDKPLNALFQAAIRQGSKAATMDAINAYLAHADRLAKLGKKRDSVSIYRELVERGGAQQGNALMGLAHVAGTEERDFILQALRGANERHPEVLTLILSPGSSESPDVEKIYKNIPAADPNLKAGLLGVLGSYADPGSLDTVLTAAGDPNDLVRRAALAALGRFDHERAVDALVATVVSGRDADLAAQSLEKSPRLSKITGKLKKALPAASAPTRVSLVRLLGHGPKAECVPVLLETLQDADPPVRAEALDALARVGDPSVYAPVLEFLAGEPDRDVRTRAMAALSGLGDDGTASAERSRLVVARLKKDDGPGRAELLALLPKVTTASSQESELKILEEALASGDKENRRAAIRAMREWPDPEVVLDILLRTAGKEPGSSTGILALRAYAEQLKRLPEKGKDSTDQEMVRRYSRGLNVAVTRPEKSGLLSGLSGLAHADALKTAAHRFDDPDVSEEAMLAAYTISAALGDGRAPAVKPVLEKIIASTANQRLKKDASILLNFNAPANAVVLFDGTDTSAWMQHRGMRIPTDEEIKKSPPCHYKLVEGTLEVADPGHLVTKQRFNDFRLHAEVWLPGEDGINSGIWTHFRYCNEIRGRGEKGGPYRLGAIYGLKAPDVDASKPARTWQTLDITFRNARFDDGGRKAENARMTVLLNGVKIHDDVEIKSRCPTLLEPEGPAPGPIVLENHSGKGRVRFRNIWVVEM